MPDLTKRGFKKPLATEGYDLNIVNFNTDNLETEFDKVSTNMEQKADKTHIHTGYELANVNIQQHIASQHAPSNAEKNVQSDWNVSDSNSDAYIKNKPNSLPASDVYTWAKQATKPSYTATEVGASASGHIHDERYYTEAEVNSLLATKALAHYVTTNTAPPVQANGTLICILS